MSACRTSLCAIALLPLVGLSLSGCSDWNPGGYSLINPARFDGDADNQAKIVKNASIYIGTLPDPEAMKAASFGAAWATAAKDGATSLENKPSAKIFLLRGVALSDRLCAGWFDRLATLQAKTGIERDFVSNGGALTGALMGFAGASAKAVGSVAAGTGFLGNEVSSYQANVIFAPSLGVVQDLLSQIRRDAAAQFARTDYNYDTAMATLIAYDRTCSHAEVKQLIDKAISNNTSLPEARTQAQIDVPIVQAMFTTGVKITLDDVVALYGLYVATSPTAADKDSLKSAASRTDGPFDAAKNGPRLRAGMSLDVLKLVLSAQGSKAALDALLADRLKPAGTSVAAAPVPATAPQAIKQIGGMLPN